MNYSDETAKRYKDEMLRLYRRSNPDSPAPQAQQNTVPPPPAPSSAQRQPAPPPRQTVTVPQPVAKPEAEPVPPQPFKSAEQPVQTRQSSAPPTSSPPDRIARRTAVPPPPALSSSEQNRPYPFLMPDMIFDGTEPDLAEPPCNPELEYCEVVPREDDRFPPVGSTHTEIRPARTQRSRGASPPPQRSSRSRTANINGGSKNSYNDSLPDEAEPPAENDPQSLPEPDDTGSGYLRIEASAADDAIPVEDVFVTVTRPSGNGKQSLVYMLITDESGKTREVELPAPPRSMSLTPSDSSRDKPFSTYTIRADKEGYYSIIGLDVPVFSGIRSIQPIRMIPVPEFEFSPPPIEYITEEPDL